jgi:hypothetical protein
VGRLVALISLGRGSILAGLAFVLRRTALGKGVLGLIRRRLLGSGLCRRGLLRDPETSTEEPTPSEGLKGDEEG